MSARTARTLATALAAVFLIAAEAPDIEGGAKQYNRLRMEAMTAQVAGDLATAEARLEAALTLYPSVPGSLIRLARVEVAAGKPEEAVSHLSAYADMGLTLDVARDPALRTLVDRPDFGAIDARLKANAEPIGDTFEWAPLEPAGGLFEGGVGYEKGMIVSSVVARTLLKVSSQGDVETLLAPDSETGGLFGMAIDRASATLWVAESRGPGIPGSTSEQRTGLLKVSLKTGKVLERHVLPPEAGLRRQLGDVAVDADGAVYASDGVSAGIFRLKPDGAKLELFIQSRNMISPQGMAFCRNARAMVVADYSTGLHRIDLDTGEETPIGGAAIGLAGTDGLLRVDYGFESGETARSSRTPVPMDLVITQNGLSPERVLYLHLSPDCRKLLGGRVLAQGRAGQQDLTLVAQSSGVIAFIGSSGWAGYDGEAKPTTATPAPGVLFVVDIPLP